MADLLASAVMMAAGAYLAVSGISCFLRPEAAARFLLGFASTAFVHYLELTLRVLVGTSLVYKALVFPYPWVFAAFGWVLIGTSIAMLFVPWRWHRQFAQWAVPQALRHLQLLGAASAALGAALVASVVWSAFV